jgi:hypothetical protein
MQWTIDTCNNVDDSPENYSEWKVNAKGLHVICIILLSSQIEDNITGCPRLGMGEGEGGDKRNPCYDRCKYTLLDTVAHAYSPSYSGLGE